MTEKNGNGGSINGGGAQANRDGGTEADHNGGGMQPECNGDLEAQRNGKDAGEIRLITGDFLELCPREVAEKSVDVVVTSPPYNIGIGYGSYRDNLPHEEYLEWTERWALEVKRTLAEGGSVFVNVGSRPSEPWVAWDVASVFRRHFRLQNVFHWVKSISIAREDVGDYDVLTRDVTFGHYKPVNSRRFVNDTHEYVFHFTRDGAVELDRTAIGVPYQDASNVGRWKQAGGGLHCRGNVWFIPYPTIRVRLQDRPHPATFPVRLPEMCLSLHGRERIHKVMDPFFGLGSTAVAARNLGLSFVGFELDPVYAQYAAERIGVSAAEGEAGNIRGDKTNGARNSGEVPGKSERRGRKAGGNKKV